MKAAVTKKPSAKERSPSTTSTAKGSEGAAQGLSGEVTTLHNVINAAKTAQDALDPHWLRVRISEFALVEGSAHRRLLIHPVELAMGQSKSEVAPRWEGRLWKHNLSRLEAFAQRASDEGVEFDALVRIDLNSRVGLVLVLEGARI